MILCAGEILADMIGAERDGVFVYERKAGGAPFNVACAVKKFGVKSAFAGSVGDDIIGGFLKDFVKSVKLDGLCLESDAQRNTTLAFVQLDRHGERSFCFYRKNTADYRMPEIPDGLFDSADIVHIGSLMLSEDEGAAYAARLAKRASSAGKTVSFDVNFRTDIFKDKESAVSRYKTMLEAADIVKFSEDEVEIFGQDYIDGRLKEKLVCITFGGNGSEWRYLGRRNAVPSVKVKPVDTTGAGDAFYAGVLSRLDGLQKSEWTDGVLNHALKFGNVCGALNTLGRGAIDSLPDLGMIQKTLNGI
ncbi:MAG: carbohydrate kinase [Clostridia bacterium]|jgi:sugar/nucleoside kinase (ribokinase family)|nr:carbohydrate kinase [Clostridia bacterium]